MKYDEKISLLKKCSTIVQQKFPPKLTNPGRFTIYCPIGSLTIGHALCDLGANFNLTSLSMIRKLNCNEPKPTHITLTLVDRSITYPYGVL